MWKTATLFRSYALATIVAIGLTAVWCTIMVLSFGIREAASYRDNVYEQLYLGKNGEPHILRYPRGVGPAQQEVLNLSREPAESDSRSLLPPMYVPRRSWYGVVKPFRFAAVNDGGVPVTFWYLVHDGRSMGRAYGVGYHSVTKRAVGYFGRKGFTDHIPARDEWFAVSGRGLLFSTTNVMWYEPGLNEHTLYLLSEGKLWSIDARKRQIRTLCTAPSDASIGWAWDLEDGPQEPPKDFHGITAWAPKKVLVRSNDSCMLVHPETGEQTSYPLPPEVAKELFAACHLSDGNLLLISNQLVSNRDGQRVIWIEPGGRVVRTIDVQLATRDSGAGEEEFAWLASLAIPFLAGQAPYVCLIPAFSVESERTGSYWESFGKVFGYYWPALLALGAIGGVAAVAAYRRQKRFGLPGALGWAVFTFLFGVPGWFSYRFHRRWPVLEECPACQQAAPRDRDACIECGADFPAPPPKGIEVFA